MANNQVVKLSTENFEEGTAVVQVGSKNVVVKYEKVKGGDGEHYEGKLGKHYVTIAKADPAMQAEPVEDLETGTFSLIPMEDERSRYALLNPVYQSSSKSFPKVSPKDQQSVLDFVSQNIAQVVRCDSKDGVKRTFRIAGKTFSMNTDVQDCRKSGPVRSATTGLNPALAMNQGAPKVL